MSDSRTTGIAKVVTAGFPAFAYMFTVGLVGFWLPLYLKRIGYPYGELQDVASVYFAALSIGSLLAGVVTDKVRRPGLVAFLGMMGNAIVVYLMYYYTGYKQILALRILQGLSLSTAIPVALGSLSHIVGRSRGVGLTSLFMASGMAIGSLLGGVLVEGTGGFKAVFYTGAFISGLAAVIALRIEVPGLAGQKSRILEGLSRLTRRVKGVVAGIFLRQLFATGVYAILAPLFRDLLGLSLLETAVALSVNPVVQGVLSLPLSRRLEGRAGTLYSLGIALTGGVFTLIYLASMVSVESLRALVAYASMILQGTAFAMVNISGNYIIISDLPREIRYTASSIFNLFFNIGWVTGTLVAGAYMRRHAPLSWLPITSLGVVIVSIITCIIICSRRG